MIVFKKNWFISISRSLSLSDKMWKAFMSVDFPHLQKFEDLSFSPIAILLESSSFFVWILSEGDLVSLWLSSANFEIWTEELLFINLNENP